LLTFAIEIVSILQSTVLVN